MTREIESGASPEGAPDSNGSIDLLAVGDNGICVNHLFDFPTTIGDHEVNVEWRRRTRSTGRSAGWADDDSRPGAIRIYGVGPGARRPLQRWRIAAVDDVIYLCHVAPAIVVLQDQAANRQVGFENCAFDGESVISYQGSIRAAMLGILRKDRWAFPLRDGRRANGKREHRKHRDFRKQTVCHRDLLQV